ALAFDLVLALAFVLVLVFLFALGVTRSGRSFFPVERFHSSYVWSVIFPLTSSSANLRRWALLLHGIGVTRASGRTPSPFRPGSSCRRARWRWTRRVAPAPDRRATSAPSSRPSRSGSGSPSPRRSARRCPRA